MSPIQPEAASRHAASWSCITAWRRRARCLPRPRACSTWSTGWASSSSTRSRCPARATTTWCSTPASTVTGASGASGGCTAPIGGCSRSTTRASTSCRWTSCRYHRISWERYVERYEQGILREQAEVVTDILAAHRATRGRCRRPPSPITATRSTGGGRRPDVARAVLEALFVVGRVGVARREGNRRYYDLIERLVPAELMKAPRRPEEGRRSTAYCRASAPRA